MTEPARLRIFGVTGGIGSGKTTLCRLLEERFGAIVVDADALGHEALRPGTSVHEALLARFGDAAVGPGGGLSRSRLAELVFSDPRARQDLEGIVHPWILERILARARSLRASGHDGILLLDAAVLLEWIERREDGQRGAIVHGVPPGELELEGVIVVTAPLEARLERLERRGMARPEAAARVRAQRTDEELRAAADWVVENAGTRRDLERAAARLWEEIRSPDR